MKIIFTLIGVVLVLLLLDIARVAWLYGSSKTLVQAAVPFTKNESAEKTLLVLGDSTAVGVGAKDPTDTIAGQLAAAEGFTLVENYAVSGARVRDIERQRIQALRTQYDMVLIQIGANDVIRFADHAVVVAQMRTQLQDITTLSENVVWIMAGNVGGAPFFPYVLRPWYTRLALQYHEQFAALAAQYDVHYINLFLPPKDDLFVQEPHTYFANDFLHPSSAGYKVWFDMIQAARVHGN